MIAPSARVIEELNARYGTILRDNDEAIKWTHYDSQAYAMAGQTILSFFQAINNDKDQSNVEQAAAFPSPKRFLLRGLGAFLVGAAFPSTSTADAGTGLNSRINDNHEVMTSGRLTITIGNKQYLIVAPLGMIPSPVIFSGFAAVHFTQAMAANANNQIGQQTNGGERGAYLLDPPLMIDSQINYLVTTEWTTVVAISAATRLFVYFLGQMIRPGQ